MWYGVIFVRSGTYGGGVFRFHLTLPEKFPDDTVPVSFFFDIYYIILWPINGIKV